MASSESAADASHADQSQNSTVQTLAVQGGRPPSDIRTAEFTKVGNCHPTLKRSGAKCKHCSTEIPVTKATVAALRKHILQECDDVPKETKERWQQEFAGLQASSTSGEEAVLAGVKRKAQADIRRHLPHSSWGLTAAEQQEVHFHLLRFAVTANLAFIQMDNPHLHAALTKLRPQYKLPSPSTFSQTLLGQEYLGVMMKLKDKISVSQNLTLALDGWTDAMKRSILAFVLQFPDRTARLLESCEASIDKHTGEFLAGLIKSVVDKHELRDKLAMLVTDNAANMVLARRLVIGSDGFKHILEMRCSMHGFSLVLKSVLVYPWAKDLLLRAQQVVTYFRASHAPLAALRAAAQELKIKQGLQSSNTTRMTSSYACTSSVQQNAPAFLRMQQDSDVVIANSDVVDILDDPAFWTNLGKLNKVLAPICRVIMVVQGDATTLADVGRCWLYLAHALGEVLPNVPDGFQAHIIWAFSTRAKQQDQIMCRLALFLDPRFRQAAISSSSNMMASFVEEAAKFGHLQGWDATKINQLMQQLSNYAEFQPPFNMPVMSTGFSCKVWWSTVGKNADAAVLAELAEVLQDVVPHAAAPERTFSTMGWFEGANSSSMNTSTTGQKVAIKMHYDAVKPHKRKCVDLQLPDILDLTGPAAISEAAAAAAGPSASAAAAAVAAAQQDQEEQEDEECTPEQLGAALQQQEAADDEERQQQEQPPEEAKTSWRAALLWSMGVEKGQDLLNPAYQEAVTGPKLRTVSAPTAGIDPKALAAQFLARQQQQQILQQHLGMPAAMMAPPDLAQQVLQQQVLQQQMLLAQFQQQQQQSGSL